jgi:hypothetical protein
MKVQALALVSALLVAATGCGGSGSTVTPNAQTETQGQGTKHLDTHTTVVPIDAKAQSSLRMPDNSIGGVPMMQVDMNLMDAPLPAGSQVNIALAGINVLKNGVTTPVVMFAIPSMIDLMSLQVVAKQYIGSVPAGTYDTLQLVVAPPLSSVYAGHQVYPVEVGTGAGSFGPLVGINVPFVISGTAGSVVNVTADFNVFESVSLQNNVAVIAPQLVVATGAGEIDGTVQNNYGGSVSNAAVVALDQYGNIINSTISANDGTFRLHALGVGTVTLQVWNQYYTGSGWYYTANNYDKHANPSQSVNVTGGSVINLGIIQD